MKHTYISVPGSVVDCIGLISGIYTDIVVPHVDMNLLEHVAYMWHLKDILVLAHTWQ